jgi:hypothetical protein
MRHFQGEAILWIARWYGKWKIGYCDQSGALCRHNELGYRAQVIS